MSQPFTPLASYAGSEGFLVKILEDPFDDASRLACADWLMELDGSENADARWYGDFVRVNLLHKRLPEGGFYLPPVCPEVYSGPFKGAPVTVETGGGGVTFWPMDYTPPRYPSPWEFFAGRGFVQGVKCSRALFEQTHAELFRKYPLIHVNITDVEPVVTEVEHGAVRYGWFGNTGSKTVVGEVAAELARANADGAVVGDVQVLGQLLRVPIGAAFPTAAALRTALSRAYVVVGRRRVGLPELDHTKLP